jgi:hypothetical protein
MDRSSDYAVVAQDMGMLAIDRKRYLPCAALLKIATGESGSMFAVQFRSIFSFSAACGAK